MSVHMEFQEGTISCSLSQLNHKSRKILWNNFWRVRLGDTAFKRWTHLINIQTGQNLKALCLSAWAAMKKKTYHIVCDLNQRKLKAKVMIGKVAQLNPVLEIPWSVACAPLSKGFSRVRTLECAAIFFSRRSS